jgi:uncharacterized membrane protein (DUF4010 family)
MVSAVVSPGARAQWWPVAGFCIAEEDPMALASHEELTAVLKFLVSMAIGLLLGLQRERTPSAKAGLRTFTLVALFGCACGLIGEIASAPWIIIAGLLLIGLMIVAAYMNAGEVPESDSGTTTVVALLFCYALGVLVWYGESRLAIALGTVATVLLQFKAELHGISNKLSRNDVASMLQFAVLSFVILPFLPDQAFDRYQVMNPHHIWLMVVLVSGISLAGYLAMRMVGPRSLPLVGTLGGLVSSTATTVAYARQSRAVPTMVPIAGAIIATSNLIPLARLVVIAAVVAPAILPQLAPVLAAGFVLGLIPLLYRLRTALAKQDLEVPQLENQTNLDIALGFGALYAIVLFVSAWLSELAGSHGLYAVAVASGFVDVDAISLSSFNLLNSGKVSVVVATTAIGIAYAAAVIFKLGALALLGGRELLAFCAPSLAGAIVGTLGGLAFLTF